MGNAVGGLSALQGLPNPAGSPGHLEIRLYVRLLNAGALQGVLAIVLRPGHAFSLLTPPLLLCSLASLSTSAVFAATGPMPASM